MKASGITFSVKSVPPLDQGFMPLGSYMEAFEKSARSRGGKPLAIALERDGGQISVCRTRVHGSETHQAADRLYTERLVKFLLWLKGGFRLYICGDEKLAGYIRELYGPAGERSFDAGFMACVYGRPFEIISLPYADCPAEKEKGRAVGGNYSGCRIGFDAGGSDRKTAAIIDGEAVFSEEVIWHPKENADPRYHFNGIVSAFKAAAAHMPRVDAIGVSSAGIYVDNKCAVASLFNRVPRDLFEKEVKDIYLRAAGEIGPVPVVVCNDGDVAALAGAMELEANNVLGIAMGTSEAAGYVDSRGHITGRLNELAFAPVDIQNNGPLDDWSGDRGCGVSYFSQDAVVRLGEAAGIDFSGCETPAQKLKLVQELMKKNEEIAGLIFETIGVYFGHGLALYHRFYNMSHVLLLGRVMSGKGGNVILHRAAEVLRNDYPEIYSSVKLHLPDEMNRRVGQAVAAAGLPG